MQEISFEHMHMIYHVHVYICRFLHIMSGSVGSCTSVADNVWCCLIDVLILPYYISVTLAVKVVALVLKC